MQLHKVRPGRGFDARPSRPVSGPGAVAARRPRARRRPAQQGCAHLLAVSSASGGSSTIGPPGSGDRRRTSIARPQAIRRGVSDWSGGTVPSKPRFSARAPLCALARPVPDAQTGPAGGAGWRDGASPVRLGESRSYLWRCRRRLERARTALARLAHPGEPQLYERLTARLTPHGSLEERRRQAEETDFASGSRPGT